MTHILIYEGTLLAMAFGIIAFIRHKKRERRQSSIDPGSTP